MKSKQSLISYQWHRGFFSNPFTFDEQGLNLWLFAAMKAQIIQNISKKLARLWECVRSYQLAFFFSDDAS